MIFIIFTRKIDSQEIEYMNALPKTRSGKIKRRLLHAKEWGEEIGDISTLENEDEVLAETAR